MLESITTFLAFLVITLKFITFSSAIYIAKLKRSDETEDLLTALLIQDSIELFVMIDYIATTIFAILYLVVIR